MRIVLMMGKGGVGKTTFSAATAVTAATRDSGRVLVASTDAAHSLAEALGTEVGCEPAEVAPNLDAVQLDGRHELQRSWSTISEYLAELLDVVDLDRLHAAELLVLPGLDQLLALARLRDFAREGMWRGSLSTVPRVPTASGSCRCPTSSTGTWPESSARAG